MDRLRIPRTVPRREVMRESQKQSGGRQEAPARVRGWYPLPSADDLPTRFVLDDSAGAENDDLNPTALALGAARERRAVGHDFNAFLFDALLREVLFNRERPL